MKSLRKQKHLRQGDIARRVGVSKSTVHSWERSERNPILAHAILWAEALGANIELNVDGTA